MTGPGGHAVETQALIDYANELDHYKDEAGKFGLAYPGGVDLQRLRERRDDHPGEVRTEMSWGTA